LRKLVPALVVSLVLLAAPTARADAGGPWYAGVAIGPHQYHGCCGIHFRASGEIGWHPSGNDTGFFLGLDLTTTLGPHFWQLQTGLRLGGDIEVWSNRDAAILLVPAGMLGLGVLDWDGDGHREHGYFVVQPSFGVALVLADRLVHLFVRPLAWDIQFFPDHRGNGFYWDAAYYGLVGVHFTFG
jgi:hypothetical protein